MQVIERREPRDHREPPPRGTIGIDEVKARLQRDVTVLARDIGERHLLDADHRRALGEAREFVAAELADAGHKVNRQSYIVRNAGVQNLEVELPGTDRRGEIIVVGAHYDTAETTPGANDNASGVAALLALARGAARRPARSRTVRLVAFCTEEPPFTRTPAMGSWVYARACRRRGDNIVAMLSLETIGYYADSHLAPHAPFPLNYVSPWRSDFLAVFGNLRSRDLVAQVVGAFDEAGEVRCKGVALPGVLPGVRSSDQWSFWKEGYLAAMLTDTAWLRYRHYHRPSDTPEKLDYLRMAQVTAGVTHALDLLALA
ncbi:MAG TPA: M28 family peptidase [Polyangiaceae bacterium]|nr:M28 family peptidase [Polyangiaceae bacterium]